MFHDVKEGSELMIKLMLMSTLPILAGGLLAINGAFDARSQQRITVERSSPPPAQPDRDLMPPKGEEFAVVAELVPDAVFIDGPSERIEYHAEISANVSTDVTYAFTARVIDDLGNVVAEVAKGEGDLRSKGVAAVAATPAFTATLADGFYILSVRVAIVSSDLEDSYEAVQFLRVRDQKMREMTATDWYQASRGSLVSLTPPGDVK